MGLEEAIVLQVIIRLVFAAICAAIANSRGRSAIGWAVIGFVILCFGLILVLVLPNLRIQEEKERRLMLENRRLRERLRKDRMVADQRHRATLGRLGVHDEALGLDTSRATETDALPPSPPPLTLPPGDATRWYYLDDDDRVGPVGAAQMRDLWHQGRIDDETLVWTRSMEDWRPLRDIEELRGVIDG